MIQNQTLIFKPDCSQSRHLSVCVPKCLNRCAGIYVILKGLKYNTKADTHVLIIVAHMNN